MNTAVAQAIDSAATAPPHPVVSADRWVAERKALLEREKELVRLQDQIARERRALPWERVAKDYVFDAPDGRRSLADLFQRAEAPGISVFWKDDAGEIFCTYSTFGRGVEVMMGTYDLLDLVPKGRDESDGPYKMDWVRHHDRYAKA